MITQLSESLLTIGLSRDLSNVCVLLLMGSETFFRGLLAHLTYVGALISSNAVIDGSKVELLQHRLDQGWISRKVLKHGISLVLRYILCSYLSLFYL